MPVLAFNALGGKFCPVTILAAIRVSASLATLSRLENPVDATQFFSLTNQFSPVAGEAAPGAPAAKMEVRGTEFADLFQAQMQTVVRQEFAAPMDGQADLQMVSLGPKINLITANVPLPDMASLATFARSQGLDDEAVRALFGDEVSEDQPLEASSNMSLNLNLNPLLPIAALVVQPQIMSAKEGATLMSPPGLINRDIVSGSLVSFSATPLGGRVDPAVVDVDVLPAVGFPNELAFREKNAVLSKSSLQPEFVLQSIEINVLPQVAKSLTVAPVMGVVPFENVVLMPEALRIRLEKPSEELTRQLSLMSGTSQKASWGGLLAEAAIVATATEAEAATPTPFTTDADVFSAVKVVIAASNPSAESWEALSLEVSPALLAELGDAEGSTLLGAGPEMVQLGDMTDISRPAPLAEPASASSEPASPEAMNEKRAVQYQQLADRLGQAVAQRLLSQIERGEWKMQLRIQPESLGRIDVALEMHAGGLDALFTSDNSVTRELIAQGATKLRDALSQSGMAVASVWVGSEQGRSSDGNPTPGRSFNGGAGQSRQKDNEVAPVANLGVKRSSAPAIDGLDVLA